MQFYNRRLLLFNQDVPIIPYVQNTEPPPPPPPPPPMFIPSLQLPPRPIFTSNLAYAFLILFTIIFFLGFLLLYLRHFSVHSNSFRRRNSSSGDAGSNPLPELPYRGHSKPQQVECAVCLDEFRDGEMVKMIPYCKHVFHPECIDTWLVTHVTCPVCRCERMRCEVERVEERGEEEGEGEGGREVGFESEGGAVSERRTRGSSRGSRFGLRRSLSF